MLAVETLAKFKIQTCLCDYVQSCLHTCLYPGYSEDGGAKKGEVIPEHEFAAGPVCLDDENEFPPVSIQKC